MIELANGIARFIALQTGRSIHTVTKTFEMMPLCSSCGHLNFLPVYSEQNKMVVRLTG